MTDASRNIVTFASCYKTCKSCYTSKTSFIPEVFNSILKLLYFRLAIFQIVLKLLYFRLDVTAHDSKILFQGTLLFSLAPNLISLENTNMEIWDIHMWKFYIKYRVSNHLEYNRNPII